MKKQALGIVTVWALGFAGQIYGAADRLPIQNTVVQEISASAELRTEIQRLAKQQQGPLWIGYEVPLVAGIGGICCDPGSACSLQENGPEQVFQTQQHAQSPHPDLRLLLKVSQGKVTQVRSFTSDCSLDAAGQPLFWIRDVKPEDSVALLSSLARPQTSGEVADSAVFAIGAHEGRSADEALKSFVRSGDPEVRQRALARLGSSRGRLGFEMLRDLLQGQENVEARKQILLGISWSQEPEAEDLLLETARKDRDAAIRGWALVRYAGKVGPRALPVLTEVIAQDPNPEVRSSAVHALRHLPEADRREVLENLAQQKADPEIQRQAQFMLDRMDGREPERPGARPRVER
jgi:hypothetical protein